MTSLDVLCMGGAHVDLIACPNAALLTATSNPGTVGRRVGGVAYNVACGLADRRRRVALIGIVGDDDDGGFIRATLDTHSITDALITSTSYPTGRYVAIEDEHGALVAGVADTRCLDTLSPDALGPQLDMHKGARWWFADANLAKEALHTVASYSNRPRLALDAVSVAKAPRLAPLLDRAELLFCNAGEANVLPVGRCSAVVITDGPAPVRVIEDGVCSTIDVPSRDVRSATGAGDRLIAATLDRLLANQPFADAVKAGIQAATSLIAATDDENARPDAAR